MTELDPALAPLVAQDDLQLREVVLRDQSEILSTGGQRFAFLGRAVETDHRVWPAGLTVAVTDVALSLVGDTGFPVRKIAQVTVDGARVVLETPQLVTKTQWVEFTSPSTAAAFARALGH